MHHSRQPSLFWLWANDPAAKATYSSRRAIVVSHDMLQRGHLQRLLYQGQTIYDALKDNANLFLMFGGHLDTAGTPHRHIQRQYGLYPAFRLPVASDGQQ